MPWMTSGETPTAAKLNEAAPGVATTAGNLIVTDATNSIAERTPDAGYVGTEETTTSTSYVDLTTPGPSVTVTTGTTALVIISASIKNDTAAEDSRIAVAVSGASTIAAAVAKALILITGAVNEREQVTYAYLETGLTAGSNVFTMKYAVSGGTGKYLYRRLTVIPF